ncbi:MAG: hypothetical protein WCA23_16845, partial [Stellaceae bacterium]
KPAAIALGEQIVLGEDLLLQGHDSAAAVVMIVDVIMSVIMMMVAVIVIVTVMIVSVVVRVARFDHQSLL